MIQPFDSLMLRVLLGPLVALMQLFGVYVFLHGHYGPGGGFQAGILLAASMILPLLTVGKVPGRLSFSLRGAVSMTAVGVMIFALIGVWSLLLGAPMLDYSVLPVAETVPYRRSMGILLIEIGVTLGVAGAMLSIFFALTGPIGGEAHR